MGQMVRYLHIYGVGGDGSDHSTHTPVNIGQPSWLFPGFLLPLCPGGRGRPRGLPPGQGTVAGLDCF